MKFTVIYEERWQSGSHWHCLTKVARFIDTPIEKIMKSPYGEKARFIFEGHPLMVGMTEIELEEIKL